MDQLFVIDPETNFIPSDMKKDVIGYLLGKTRMSTLQHKINQSRDPFIKEIREEYKGKYLDMDQIRKVLQAVADNHIDRMAHVLSTTRSCQFWFDALDYLRGTKDNMWFGKIDARGLIKIKSAKEFAETNGILSFIRESKKVIEVDGEKKRIKTYLAG